FRTKVLRFERSIVRYFFRCPWPLRRAIAQPCWVALPSSSSLCRGEYSSARVWLTGLSGGKPPHKKCPYSLKNVEPHYEECESISLRENRRSAVVDTRQAGWTRLGLDVLFPLP